ncbi:MAG: 5,10-methylenetetrahydromethanopterin reductase [Halobacteriales archaeon]|nr:5,10-methylenetetrahydromethanopterin reductase [Halobacteriales archaeon]
MRGIELAPDRPVDELVELGAAAEDAGFDTAFVASHYNNRDPFAALTRLATATTDVRLGPGVVNPYETHPVALASRAATLQELSGGRAVFGIGAGDRSTLANLGLERERPLARVAESITVSRQLWAGERVDHDGTFAANDAGLNYGVEPPPVYVGAQGPGMLRLAARFGDGVLVNASHPRDVAWSAEQLADGLADRPDERGELEVAVSAVVSVAEDADAAREAARPPVAYIAAGAPEAVLDRHGLDAELAGEIGAGIGAGAYGEAFAAVSEPMLDAFAVAGTPEAVAERFGALLEHADSVVAGSPLGPEPDRAVELLSRAYDAVGQ